jgi:hypothetical protein
LSLKLAEPKTWYCIRTFYCGRKQKTHEENQMHSWLTYNACEGAYNACEGDYNAWERASSSFRTMPSRKPEEKSTSHVCIWLTQ